MERKIHSLRVDVNQFIFQSINRAFSKVLIQASVPSNWRPTLGLSPIISVELPQKSKRMTIRFTLRSIEKEARQVIARGGPTKDTDRGVMAKLLRDPANKYLARQLCWVLSVQGVETYILMPRDGDYQPLIDAYRAELNPGNLELVIGVRGPEVLETRTWLW